MNEISSQPSEHDYRIAVLAKMVQMRHILEPSFKHSMEGHTFDDAFNLVATGKGMFYWNDDSCAVLEWRNYPIGLVIHCLWAGGTQQGLFDLYEVVAGCAKTVGAKAMTTLGREGFKKRLPKEGWKVAGVWFYKEIK